MKFAAMTMVAVLGVGLSLQAAPVNASTSDRPTLLVPSKETIPPRGCYYPSNWMRFANTGNGKGTGVTVEVRKSGYSRATGSKICAWMGSGNYHLKTWVNWKLRKRVRVKEPVYATREVTEVVGNTRAAWVTESHTFACDLVSVISVDNRANPPILRSGFYQCRFDDGTPWPPDPNTQPYVQSVNPASSLITWLGPFPSGGNAQIINTTAPYGLGPTVTGRVGMTVWKPSEPIYETRQERYIDHYNWAWKTKWVTRSPFLVQRTITVRVG